jgi:hypothetical protein
MARTVWSSNPSTSKIFLPSPNVHTCCAALTLSYSMVPGLFPWCWTVVLTTYLPLVSRLRMSGVLFYTPSYAFVAFTDITWPSLDIYVYLYACAYRCVRVCVCVCAWKECCPNGESVGLCSGGTSFESWPGHRLASLIYFVAFLSPWPSDKCQDSALN